MNKFDDLFMQYNCIMNDETVKADIDKILAAHYAENDNKEVYKQCLNQIDLTSLNGTDTHTEIITMVNKVNDFKKNVSSFTECSCYLCLSGIGSGCKRAFERECRNSSSSRWISRITNIY